MATTHDLLGVRPEPLASYLVGVGVLRVVGEQADPSATARWAGDSFELATSLGADELVAFFADRYRPTPLVAPWNGGSGFHDKDNTKAIDAIVASDTDRLADYREAILAAREMMQLPQWVSSEGDKAARVELCRGQLPDAALGWLDAAVVLTDVRQGREFPPLLGTGGNVGRLEFSNNFMQRIVDVLALDEGRRAPSRDDSAAWARAALFGDPTPLMAKQPIGQFDPGAAGGANMGSLPADPLLNPWTYVLMLEGAVLFASGTARRLGSAAGSAGAMPFTFRPTASGHASASEGESVKGELWMPLWHRHSSVVEISRLVRESRLAWGRQQAADGLDAARAVATLGVDRGVSGFVRYTIAERLGQAMLAVPSGRVTVADVGSRHVAITGALDAWMDRCRRVSDRPAAAESGLSVLSGALFELARRPGSERLLKVLVAAAALDDAIGRSGKMRERVGPLVLRNPDDWIELLPLERKEVRLALSLASSRHGTLRALDLLRPIQRTGGLLAWRTAGAIVADSPSVGRRLSALLRHRATASSMSAESTVAGSASAHVPAVRGTDLRPTWAHSAPIECVNAFLTGDLDDSLIDRSLRALLLIDHAATGGGGPPRGAEETYVEPPLAVLAPFACVAPSPSGIAAETLSRFVAGKDWPRTLASGRVDDVLEDALDRLRIAGRRPLVRAQVPTAVDGERLAAALCFPIGVGDALGLLRRHAPLATGDTAADAPATAAQEPQQEEKSR